MYLDERNTYRQEGLKIRVTGKRKLQYRRRNGIKNSKQEEKDETTSKSIGQLN